MKDNLSMPEWQKIYRDSFHKQQDLAKFLGVAEMPHSSDSFETLVSQGLAERIKAAGPSSVLWKQYVPSFLEQEVEFDGAPVASMLDPIGDKAHLSSKQIIHRYKNRVLFMPTSRCGVICRYCFRKNLLGEKADKEIFRPNFEETLNYLRNHPEIEEIIFSGGDPLMLSDEKIRFYGESFAQIPHIKYLRFHTRIPMVMPERLDQGFLATVLELKKKFSQVVMALHVNHLDEFTPEISHALQALTGQGVKLISQTVLLKGVNDNIADLKNLFEGLGERGIAPYYLHHPDRVKGGMHFYLPLREGRDLYRQLRDEVPGWLLPHYIIDIPGGGGKTTAYNPESLEYGGSLIHKDGQSAFYPE
jgi:lysine 2,3-aminomutase